MRKEYGRHAPEFFKEILRKTRREDRRYTVRSCPEGRGIRLSEQQSYALNWEEKVAALYPGFCPGRLVKPGITITLSGLLGHEGGHLWTGLALLRTGFTVPRLLPCARCALTAPFHPYPCGRFIFCGTFRPAFTPARFFKRHTALWSPEVPPPALKLAGSGYLGCQIYYTKFPVVGGYLRLYDCRFCLQLRQ